MLILRVYHAYFSNQYHFCVLLMLFAAQKLPEEMIT
nr:MAG TPA: hypothetical protein [Caudoviricetes sp.]